MVLVGITRDKKDTVTITARTKRPGRLEASSLWGSVTVATFACCPQIVSVEPALGATCSGWLPGPPGGSPFSEDRCASDKRCLFPMLSKWQTILIYQLARGVGRLDSNVIFHARMSWSLAGCIACLQAQCSHYAGHITRYPLDHFISWPEYVLTCYITLLPVFWNVRYNLHYTSITYITYIIFP